MTTSRILRAGTALTLLVGGVYAGPGTARAEDTTYATSDRSPTELTMETVSNRADLVSGGDVLVRVGLPKGTSAADVVLAVNGKRARSVTNGPDGPSLLARLDGLRLGANTVTAAAGRRKATLTVTNHPIGGPIFTGPQLKPWFCDTEKAGLGPATDRQCNAPTAYRFFYRTPAGVFLPYDPKNPPPAAAVATTTIDSGRIVPYVVRLETTTINRGISYLAALFDPTRVWTPLAPQAGWNGKLYWLFGSDCTPGRRQSVDTTLNSFNGGRYGPFLAPNPIFLTDNQVTEPPDVPQGPGEDAVLDDMALSRGFLVASSTLTNLGNNCNTALHAETLMMTKERIVEQYGPIRYTIGVGCSGGSISQHGISSQYPGLLQGLRPMCSFPDVWSILTANSVDCPLLNRYFDNNPGDVAFDPDQRDGVYGWSHGTAFCHQPEGNFRPAAWNPSIGGAGTYDLAVERPCVPATQVYDPERNPRGVRCTPAENMINVLGHRAKSSWGPVEREIGRGFANRFLDNVGVQYGLAELRAGRITPDQFVDLNAHIGGLDIDGQWQTRRMSADLPALTAMYRSGQIVDGRALDSVAIIDYRSNSNADVHDNRQASYTRERIAAANGNTRNHARWLEAVPGVVGLPSAPERSFTVLDQWLSATEADTGDAPYADKLARHRPAAAADGCFQLGGRVSDDLCAAAVTLPADPRLVAGMNTRHDVLKCALAPLDRSDYSGFTDGQWQQLRDTFPTGVCDWTKPGIGQRPAIPWLTYAAGPGGRLLGAPPASRSRIQSPDDRHIRAERSPR